jgi:hypothetical protein
MSNPEQPLAGAPRAPMSAPVYEERDRIVLLTPCADWHLTQVYVDSRDLCRQLPTARFRMADGSVQVLPVIAQCLTFTNDSHIDRQRNSLLWEFEKTHYRFGAFMDSDQPFTPEDMGRIWIQLMQGAPLVCGLVALKSIVPTFVANTLPGEKPDPATGLLKIKDGGTGFMAFNREKTLDVIREQWPRLVRERVAKAIHYPPDDARVDRALEAMAALGYSSEIGFKSNPNTRSAGQTVQAYFSSGVTLRDGHLDWLSEDWMLCHRCRELGIPIHADTNVRLQHLGRLLFPPPAEEVIESALAYTSGAHPPFDHRLAKAAAEALRALQSSITDQSITVLHATRRPEQAKRIRELFLKNALQPSSIGYIFGVDEDDHLSQLILAEFNPVVVPGGQGIVAALNAAAAKSTGRILVMAADDCIPPIHWDREIREALKGQLHEPRLLWTSDGYSNQPVVTHPIMTRALYESQGWFFCPEYPHLFCDTELTVRAQQAGQVIDARHITFKHQHPMFTGAKPDALHAERNSKAAWETGRAIFTRRNPGVDHPHARQS